MKWVTRERPKIDRIACPWLITRFIDDAPEFLYVPADQVFEVAEREGAIAYDIPGAQFSHVGERCSFDAFLDSYGLGEDPALQPLPTPVRGPDTSPLDITPQTNGTSEFLYLPADQVFEVAEREGAIAYDIPGAEFSHVGEKCSFDAFLDRYGLGEDPALQQLATIVRGADTSHLDLTPQSSGLFAISLGLSAIFPDDHEMLRHGMTMYDALYAWCRSGQGETHNWPPTK